MASTTQSTPIGLKWRSSTTYILVTIATAMFTDLFLYGIIVPTIPFLLHDRLGVPQSKIQALTSTLLSCYAFASLSFSIPAGVIADKLPARQIPFLGGLFSLLASTILLYAGQTVGILILARILQGMSAAVVWTVGLAIVRDTVGSEKLGVTIGNIFAFISVGELVAPLLGGIMYDNFGNGAVFAMGFALLGVDFVMRFVMIEKKTARKYGLDEYQSSTEHDVESGEGSPLIAKKYDDDDAWKIAKEQPWLIQKVPIIYTLRNPRLLTAQLVSGTQAVILGVFESTLPTETQVLFGFPSMKVGFLFIPLLLPYLLLGGLGGKAVDKYGGRIAATIGYAYIAIPLVLLRIPHAGGTPEIVKFCVFLAMSSCGQALINSPGLVEASYVLERYHLANKELFGEDGPYAQLYALNSLMFSGGLTVGPLMAGALREKIGYGNMNAVVAGMCLVMSALSWMFLGKIPKKS